MICKNCNTLNSNDTLSCVNCGELLEKKNSPYINKSSKIEPNEILLDKAPKEIVKKNRSSFVLKMQNEHVLQSLVSVSLMFFLVLMTFNPLILRIGEQILAPFVNLSQNITIKIGNVKEDGLDSLLVADIIPQIVKKEVVRKKMTSVIIKPAEIKKDKVMEYYINLKDSMKMILVPAGETEIGSDNEGENEKPLHTASVNAFFMDQHEITNRQYRQFILETGYKPAKFMSDSRFNGPEQPVVGVSYEDASAYARWAGKRLPTENEWERAARAAGRGLIYPSGSNLTPALACYDLSPASDSPNDVKSYQPNRYFIYDLAGNAAEWTSSVPKPHPGGTLDKDYGSNYRIVKGGCWKNIATDATIAKRDVKGIKWNGNDVGFRCVMDY